MITIHNHNYMIVIYDHDQSPTVETAGYELNIFGFNVPLFFCVFEPKKP